MLKGCKFMAYTLVLPTDTACPSCIHVVTSHQRLLIEATGVTAAIACIDSSTKCICSAPPPCIFLTQ
jgi:hypothetical protein